MKFSTFIYSGLAKLYLVIGMAEIKLEVPEEELEGLSEDWQKIALEAIISRAFELRLEKSRKLQRAIFEMLASKSKLTRKDALELGSKLNEGLLKELKERKLL